MIFISAQPDDFYFTWQLELQIRNLNRLGVPPSSIHVLIGISPQKGLAHYFRTLVEKYCDKASFFIYPDTRNAMGYLSSLRPHIIRKHFASHPSLEKETIFYHDADVLFRELPDFGKLIKNDTWYVSDTRGYLDTNYIKEVAGEKLFRSMCEVVGIDSEIVTSNDKNCGGAQYLIKNTTAEFWGKIERDSENLYKVMQAHNNLHAETIYINAGLKRSEYFGIQSWCADMWAMFWNALLLKKDVQIHPDLDFLWATSPFEQWEAHKILHYTGNVKGFNTPIFCKEKYLLYPPYHDPFVNRIKKKTVSYYVAKSIRQVRKDLDKARIKLKDVTFIISVRIDSDSRLVNLECVVLYLTKYFDTNILVIESDVKAKIKRTKLPVGCSYVFLQDEELLLNRTKIHNCFISKVNTNFVALYDTDAVLPISQIVESITILREKKAEMVSPYDGRFVSTSNIFKSMFIKILDPDLLVQNIDKLLIGTCRSYGGAVFFEKNPYMKVGMDNEFFTSWGPEDIERIKRMRNFGFRVLRINGPLFHLPHERKDNSGYYDQETHIKFMEEYFKISSMDKEMLQKHMPSRNHA